MKHFLLKFESFSTNVVEYSYCTLYTTKGDVLNFAHKVCKESHNSLRFVGFIVCDDIDFDSFINKGF